MRHALVFNVISFVTFILAVVFLFTKGLHLSVEFTGGTLIEVKYEQAADLEKIRGALGKSGFSDYSVQNFGSSQDVMIRLPLKGEQNTSQLGEAIMKSLATEAPGAALRASSSSARRSARNSPRTAPWPCCWSSSAS
jgi:preprotein translocase subunit SecF